MQLVSDTTTAGETGLWSARSLARARAAAALVLIPLLYFHPAWLGRVMLAPGDGWTQIFGIRVLAGQLLARGEWPLWNPYIFSGMPLLASLQPGALYPPIWLFAALPPAAAMNAMVILTYHIALIGTYLYLRRIDANRAGALVGGIAFAFGGFMIGHLGHTNRIAAAAWLPWIVLAVEQLFVRLRWRWVTLGAGFVAMQALAGEFQMSFYTALVAAGYALGSLVLRPPVETRRRFLFGLAAMGGCGALMSAVQLLPTRELLALGERAGITYEYFAGYSFPPARLPQLIFPYFFGGGGMRPYRIPFWGGDSLTEILGYVGLATLTLAVVLLASQWVERRIDPLTLLWAGCALIALVLAFGAYLPLKLHRGLWHVPVYNLFRASARHMLEFDFALAVLAGLGVTRIARPTGGKDRAVSRRVLALGIGAMAAAVAALVIVYCVFSGALAMGQPLNAGAASPANAELWVPILCFLAGAAAIGWYARRRTRGAAALLVAVVLADLASFGFFYEWNVTTKGLPEKLSDAPPVEFIKTREADWNLFRVLSHAGWPYARNYEQLNFPNVSIVRGLQSVNGYDPLFLNRYSEVAGGMGVDGIAVHGEAFDLGHRGFDLLNAKYLLHERPDPARAGDRIEIAGIPFNGISINLRLRPGERRTVAAAGAATELALVSAMGNSPQIATGTPVARLTLHAKDGRRIERELLAGRDTSEWAFDRPGLQVRHTRAPIAESFEVGGFSGHHYLARLRFERAEIERIEVQYELREAELLISRASLHDASTNRSQPLEAFALPPARWRRLAEFDDVDLYENLRAMPRAWFAQRGRVLPAAEALQAIKTGVLPDGAAFDPAETVLFQREDLGGRTAPPPIEANPSAEVRLTRYEAHRIELQTRNAGAGFLVLSEIWYRGWEAWIDGRRAPVERVNYVLRGLSVPAGDHRIEFRFRAPSFRNGAAYSALGAGLLLIGAFWRRGKRHQGRCVCN
jgi:Bacterial membrane protein YfhO